MNRRQSIRSFFNPKNHSFKNRVLFSFLCLVCFGYLSDAMAADGLTVDTCTFNTADEGRCKDCCDCLDDATQRQSCRDACLSVDFSQNFDFITIDAPSVLGPDGDYTAALNMVSEQACKGYCDASDTLACGDRRYCRDACNNAFSGLNGDSDSDTGNNISIEQAISDEAQMKTIAFSGLAFLTGDMCSDTFFPPGKVSDFFGFQYMRDIAPNGFGHNTEFAGRISDSVLAILTNDQVQALVDLANTQAELIDAYGFKRFVLIDAFRRLLENDLPDGANGLSKSAVIEFSADLYEIDGEISYGRANVIGNIVANLTTAQETKLVELQDALNTLFENAGEGGDIANEDWPKASPVDLSGLTVSDGRVLVSTFATQLYSWYLGSVEGDTYFCPERHGTYFGSFYMKDIPPLTATQAVTIDTNLTADMGTDFLNTLDTRQQALITDILDIQRTALTAIVSKRKEISEQLRPFMNGTTVDKDEVLALVRQYGEYDGEIIYTYATNYAAVEDSLTDTQADTIMELRTSYYALFPDYQTNNSVYDCLGAWLYASKVDMPETMNTDFLFGTSESLIADGAELTLIANGFSFAEGPAADISGDLYFSDILANRVYRWSIDNELTVFRENSGGSNGLFFDLNGDLLACEGSNGRVVAIDPSRTVTVLTYKYNGLSFNEPNDLWVTPSGGVYFTDPVYFRSEAVQDGEYVYYLSPDRKTIMRVIEDMIKPNGIIGTGDGTTLYVTDHGAGKTYRYTINSDGALSHKQLFSSVGADGMTIDSLGNVYLCAAECAVLIFDVNGNKIETISVPEQPTNVCFGGNNAQTLFITTQNSVYALNMNVSLNSVDSYQDTMQETNGDMIENGSSGGCFIKSLYKSVKMLPKS